MKCAELTDAQLRTVSVPRSPLTLLGLVQHMVEVERNWFRRVLTGEQVSPFYDAQADLHGRDGGFDLRDDISFQTARATWEGEISVARANCSERDLEQTSPIHGRPGHPAVDLHSHDRRICRHNGHADLIRERIDGTTGV